MGITISGGGITIGGGISFNAPANYAVAVSQTASPYVVALPWSTGSGFGAKYSDPGTLPPGAGSSVTMTQQADAVMVGTSTISPYVTAYPFNKNTGFGTKYANPSVLPVTGGFGVNGVGFNAAGTAVAMATDQTPYISAYSWSSATGFGAKYSNPGTTMGNAGSSISWSPVGDAVAIGGRDAGNIAKLIVYKWTNASGFGTGYVASYSMSGGGTQPNNIPQTAWSPDGSVIVAALASLALNPAIFAWPWNSSTGLGSTYANPSTLPIYTAAAGIAFSADGAAVILTGYYYGGAKSLEAYHWSNATGWGTKYSSPSVTLSGAGKISMLPGGSAFAIAADSAVDVYDWDSSTGFGTKYTNATVTPNDVAFA